MYGLVRQLLFRLAPEASHRVALGALAVWGALPDGGPPTTAAHRVMGIGFANHVGLAAGLDKDAQAVPGFARLGFGHIEVGTVTPRPQPGNPPPRLFRLPYVEALINRMGFNNAGMYSMARRLADLRRAERLGCTRIGVNIGKNWDTPLADAHQDYLACMATLYEQADYLAVNLSSPNTPGLRALQAIAPLRRLLDALKERQAVLAARHSRYVPLAVKIAPDLTIDDLRAIAAELLAFEVDGVIATNTTVSRPVVPHPARHAAEAGGLSDAPPSVGTLTKWDDTLTDLYGAGGLSGAPLAPLARRTVAHLDKALDGRIPIIGVGGIMTAADAQAMLNAGAALVQIYTGLIYRGPGLVRSIADLTAN